MSAVDENTPAIGVDETPISPVQRRDSLEKHLQHRPEAQDLKNRNILLDTKTAPWVTRQIRAHILQQLTDITDHCKLSSWSWNANKLLTA